MQQLRVEACAASCRDAAKLADAAEEIQHLKAQVADTSNIAQTWHGRWCSQVYQNNHQTAAWDDERRHLLAKVEAQGVFRTPIMMVRMPTQALCPVFKPSTVPYSPP